MATQLSSHHVGELIVFYAFAMILFVGLLASTMISMAGSLGPYATLRVDVWFVILIVALVVFGQLFERRINQYEVSETQIRFLLFRCIPIARIKDSRHSRAREMFFLGDMEISSRALGQSTLG